VAFLDHLTQTLTRRRVSKVADTRGGYTPTNTDVTFLGLLSQRGTGEDQVGGRDTALADYRLYYPTTLDLVSSDLVIDAAGNQYDVGVPRNVHELDEVGQCDCRLKRDKA